MASTPPKLETSRQKVPRPAAQTSFDEKLTRRGLGRLGLLILLLGRLGLGLAAHGDGGLWFVLLLVAQLALWYGGRSGDRNFYLEKMRRDDETAPNSGLRFGGQPQPASQPASTRQDQQGP